MGNGACAVSIVWDKQVPARICSKLGMNEHLLLHFTTETVPNLLLRSVPIDGPPLGINTIYQMGLVLSKFSFGEDDYNPTFQPGISYKPICTTYRTHSVYCLFTSFTSTEVHFLALFVQKHKY